MPVADLCLLFFTIAASFSGVFSDDLSFVVGQSTALQVVPKVPVSNSPGLKSGSSALAERVLVNGLSRMKNLKKISHSVTVKVSHVNSSLYQHYIGVCFHRNLSLSLGMCPRSQWQRLSNGSWARKMSPFDHILLDIRMDSSSGEVLDVTVEEDFSAYRIVFLVLGILLLTLAPILSESLLFYYSSAMAVGVILVVLIVLFQGMKLLPTGRGNSFAIFIYSSIVGIGSFLLKYLPQLLQTVLTELGISEDMYTPLVAFSLLFVILAGAWLGFWVVRKLVLTEDGLIDSTISLVVAWSVRIVSGALILQCSLDPLLAVLALLFAFFISSILRKAINPRRLRRLYRKIRRVARKGHPKSLEYDSSPTDAKHPEHIDDFQCYNDAFSSPTSWQKTRTPSYSPVTGLHKKSPSLESETFYSTYHKTSHRKKISNEEWKNVTKEYTKKGLEELVSSPDFSRWAVAHAERITLAPIQQGQQRTSRWRRWFSWFR